MHLYTVQPSSLGIGDQEALCVVKGEKDSETVSRQLNVSSMLHLSLPQSTFVCFQCM